MLFKPFRVLFRHTSPQVVGVSNALMCQSGVTSSYFKNPDSETKLSKSQLRHDQAIQSCFGWIPPFHQSTMLRPSLQFNYPTACVTVGIWNEHHSHGHSTLIICPMPGLILRVSDGVYFQLYFFCIQASRQPTFVPPV